MDKLQLSPPWITFYEEVKAMFQDDPSVRVVFDQQDMVIKLYVESSVKAAALEELLVKEAEFGTVSVKLTVIPGNKVSDSYVNAYARAFENNPTLVDTKSVTSPLGDFTYVIWSCRPVQFFNDNLGDFQGKTTMLLEDVAYDVMADRHGVYHCTEQCGLLDARPAQWP